MAGPKTKSKPRQPSEVPDRPITRDDIEQKFNALQSDVGEATESAKGTLIAVGAAVAVVVVLGAYILGRKRGRKKNAFIEIRRV